MSLTQSEQVELSAMCMPPELLAYVFVLLNDSRDLGSASGCRYRSNAHPLAFSQVCRRWRAIALDCANLWTDIRTSSPEWVALALKRSKCSPLTMRVNSRSHLRALDLCRPSFDRTCLLDISFHPRGNTRESSRDELGLPSLSALFDVLSECDAPKLEELVMNWTEYTTLSGSDGVSFRDDIFRRTSLPCLRVLKLNICGIVLTPHSRLFVPTLTHLHLSIHPFPWTSLDSLLTFLGHMSLLEEVRLGHVSLPASSLLHAPSITLPRLQEFVLNGHPKVLASILYHVSGPLQRKLHLGITFGLGSEYPDDSDSARLPHSIDLFSMLVMEAFGGKRYHTARLSYLSDLGYDHQTELQFLGSTHSPAGTPHDIKVSFSHYISLHDQELMLSRFCDVLVLDDLEEVDIVTSEQLDLVAYINNVRSTLFSRLGFRAKHLSLSRNPAARMIFDNVINAAPHHTSALPHFPQVRSLTIRNVTGFMGQTCDPHPLFGALVTSYAVEQAADNDKRRLALVRCLVSEEMEDVLRANLRDDFVTCTESVRSPMHYIAPLPPSPSRHVPAKSIDPQTERRTGISGRRTVSNPVVERSDIECSASENTSRLLTSCLWMLVCCFGLGQLVPLLYGS
ncbi:hypothetical protein K488DRAFT_69916 [Vararia minispora EC-137]|uniref:Uncharacterized protein n=1 Tax=Vararia minispora EC-137 TaxID=1314806 RepID=A0ACB8QPF1_9AGAM|nr:hypothetical protein K488DRAFT_69916 [Vararia minispora EC-137]